MSSHVLNCDTLFLLSGNYFVEEDLAFYTNSENQSLADESVRKTVPVPASYPPGDHVANISFIGKQPGEGLFLLTIVHKTCVD